MAASTATRPQRRRRLVRVPNAADNHLGQLLKTGRTARGLTQAQAAQRAHVASSTWSRAERGTDFPTEPATIAAMSMAAGLDPGKLKAIGHGAAADLMGTQSNADLYQLLDEFQGKLRSIGAEFTVASSKTRCVVEIEIPA